MKHLKYCPMAQQDACLHSKCAFFDDDEKLCIILLGYYNNLATSILVMPSLPHLELFDGSAGAAANAASLVQLEALAAPIVRLLRTIDRFLAFESLPKCFRKKLLKVKQDIHDAVQSDVFS
ncbi:MAG: hypothetical protein Q8M98_09910 [Candidatus Cloacimonadaceae bacterium]|nr:hypothetical protein [Candidatus Cloacimonadaceae bacterium]